MYPEQRAAFYGPARLALTEACTKAGKTFGGMYWALDKTAELEPGQAAWWVAPVYAQAVMVMRRYMRGLARFPVRFNKQELTMTLPGAGTMFFKSAVRPDNLYGEDVYAALVDEASRVQTDSITAVRSTPTSTQGPWRMIGNVRGVSNRFYQLCRQTERGELADASYTKIDAVTASQYGIPGLPTAHEIENARRVLPEPAFKELYEVDPSSDGTNPFGVPRINACIRPLAPGPAAVFGVDLAKVRDYTVILGLNRESETCYLERFKDRPWGYVAERVARAASLAPTMVDATGVGSPVVDMVRDKGQYVARYLSAEPLHQPMLT